MASKSTIEERDGQTVLVTPVSSEAKGHELAASIEDDRLRTEGGWWSAARANLDATLKVGSQIFETIDRSFLVLLGLGFCAIASVLAALSWPAFVPIEGIEWLIACGGVLLVWACAVASHQVFKAFKEKDDVEGWGLVGGIVGCIFLNLVASVALQARMAVENDAGWKTVQAYIVRLENERGALQIQTISPPKAGEAARLERYIAALRSQGATNRIGDTLKQSVDELVGDCTKPPDYYTGKYCPELKRLEGDLEQARTAERAFGVATARITAIDAEIKAQEAKRPKPPAGLELVRMFLADFAALAPFVPPALFSVVMELLMVLLGFLAGRRAWKRRNP